MSTVYPLERKRYIQTHRNAKIAFTKSELEDINFWSTIFRNDVWLNKVISHGLYPAVIGNIGEHGAYLILALINENVKTCVDQNSVHTKHLLKSLQSKSYCLEKQEVKFKDFTLHVGEIFEGSEAAIDVTDPRKLYQEQGGKATTKIKYYVDTSPTIIYNIEPMVAAEDLVVVKIPHFNHPTRVYYKRRKIDQDLRRSLGTSLG